MKTKFVVAAFAATLFLGVFAQAGVVAQPISTPAGLAVDAHGSFYVANNGGNNILVYNSSYVQQTSATITDGINAPIGVQFDPSGNLWVSNFDGSKGARTGSITEYTGGVLQTSHTITRGIVGPMTIFFDGLGNLWVLDDQTHVTIYSPTSPYGPPLTLVRTITPSSSLDSIGLGAGVVFTSTDTDICFSSASVVFLKGTIPCNEFNGWGAFALASDNSGNVYQASLDSKNDVFFNDSDNHFFLFTSLPFASSRGMAVDNVNHRLYISNTSGNKIVVYSLASATYGKLLKTIR